MIKQTYPSQRKAPWERMWSGTQQQQKKHNSFYIYNRQPTPGDVARSLKLKITPTEFIRRDDVVHKLVADSGFSLRDKVYPLDKQAYKEHGECEITNICQSYYDFSLDEVWPKNDNPFILAIRSVDEAKAKKDGVLLCTLNYVKGKQ